jgi:hypothetical protein
LAFSAIVAGAVLVVLALVGEGIFGMFVALVLGAVLYGNGRPLRAYLERGGTFRDGRGW